MTRHQKPAQQSAESRPAASSLGRLLLAAGVLACVGIVVLMIVDPWQPDDGKPSADGESRAATPQSKSSPDAAVAEPPIVPARPAVVPVPDPEAAREEAVVALQEEESRVVDELLTRFPDHPEAKGYREKFKTLKAKDDEDLRAGKQEDSDLNAARESVAQTRLRAGRIYQQQGLSWQAEKHWRRSAELAPKDTMCRLELGAMYRQKNRLSDALRIGEQLLEIEPDNALFHANNGALYVRLKRFDKARESARRAMELEPENEEYAELYESIEAQQ